MQKRNTLIIAVLLLMMWTLLPAAEPTGREIMEMLEDANSSTSAHSVMTMELIDSKGDVRSRVIEQWSQEYDQEAELNRSIMVFHTPASVKGTRFLQVANNDRDDDQWIYMPALGRVRRIASGESGGSFMGSDVSYEDMQSRDLDDYTFIYLKSEEKLGMSCWVVESIPKPSADSDYSRTIVWVHQEKLVIVATEMYDQDDKLYKIMNSEGNLVQVNGIWTFTVTRITDVQKDHSTRMVTKNSKSGDPMIEFNKPINPKRFTQAYLKTGQVR